MVVTMMMWWQWRDGKKCEGRNGNAININGGMQENKLKILMLGGRLVFVDMSYYTSQNGGDNGRGE